MANEKQQQPSASGTEADAEITRIIEAAEPGVDAALRVVEANEAHYFAAVNGSTTVEARAWAASGTG